MNKTDRRTLNAELVTNAERADTIFALAREDGNRELNAKELSSLDGLTMRNRVIETRLNQLNEERDRAGAAHSGTEERLVSGVFTGPRFHQMFPSASTDSRGWESLGAFVNAAANRLADPRLQASSDGANSVAASDGGFLIPTQFYAGLLDASLEDEICRPRARVIPMTSDIVEAPIWDK